MPQALFCRWFQPTVLNTRGKASSSVGFIPFHNIISGKGLKPTEESGKTERLSIRQLKLTAKESLRHGALPH